MTKKSRSEWDSDDSPVWVVEDNMIKPSPYFLKWWQDVSTMRYGDNME